MISFAAGEDGEQEVRPGRDIEVEGAFAIIMRERVDQEGEVPDQDSGYESRPDQAIQARLSVAIQHIPTQQIWQYKSHKYA